MKIKRALISVSDKTGVVELAKKLHAAGVEIVSTGGTMKAACDLVAKFNPKKIMVNFIIEITDEGLHGRDVFDKDTEVTTLIRV